MIASSSWACRWRSIQAIAHGVEPLRQGDAPVLDFLAGQGQVGIEAGELRWASASGPRSAASSADPVPAVSGCFSSRSTARAISSRRGVSSFSRRPCSASSSAAPAPDQVVEGRLLGVEPRERAGGLQRGGWRCREGGGLGLAHRLVELQGPVRLLALGDLDPLADLDHARDRSGGPGRPLRAS